MLKRVVPFLCAVVVLVASLAPSAHALSRDDFYFIDLDDYTSSYSADADGRFRARVSLPSNLCAAQTIDKNGTVYGTPGTFSGEVFCSADTESTMAVCAYWPGGFISGVFLDAPDIPDGTEMSVEGQFTLSDVGYQSEVGIYARLGVTYFDAQYQVVGYQRSQATYFNIDDSQITGSHAATLKISKPTNAVYFVYYATFDMSVYRSNDEEVGVKWQIYTPNIFVYANEVSSDENAEMVYFDSVTWLKKTVDSFLDLEFAPNLSFNKVLNIVLCVGLLLWFFKIIS